jgi:hypothetical protein
MSEFKKTIDPKHASPESTLTCFVNMFKNYHVDTIDS